jgi:hypothetical protein
VDEGLLARPSVGPGACGVPAPDSGTRDSSRSTRGLHGSVVLTEHVGVHAQFSVTAADGLTLIQGGIGLGIQG